MENEGKATPGLELIRRPGATAEEIATLIFEPCPPFACPEEDVYCDCVRCRECWEAWLTTGEPVPDPRKKGYSTNRVD